IRLVTFAACAIGLVLVGQLDDRFDISARWRIGAQALAGAAMMLVAGVTATNLQDVFGFAGSNIGLFAFPCTIFVVDGVVSALDMCGDVDGRAGSLVQVTVALLSGFALHFGNFRIAVPLPAVAAALVGILLRNLRFPWQPRTLGFVG